MPIVFKHFQEELNKEMTAAKAGMEKATTVLEADTKLMTHVLSGALRRSWTHKVSDNGGTVEGAVGSNLRYAPYEDDYHGNISSALEKDKGQLFDIIAEEVKSALGG